MRIIIIGAALLLALLGGAARAAEDDGGGGPQPTPTAVPLPETSPGAQLGLHMPTTDPYCWQLWVERAKARQAVCGARPCPPPDSGGCSVVWWVGACRATTLSCRLGPQEPGGWER